MKFVFLGKDISKSYIYWWLRIDLEDMYRDMVEERVGRRKIKFRVDKRVFLVGDKIFCILKVNFW